MRIGHGYDVHILQSGRDLILGGERIAYEKGLLGHSDADVLTHAIMDALLGAASLGNIGTIFPDTDDTYKNANSINLLKKVYALIRSKGYNISNIDCTIIAQAPKLNPHIKNMRKNISDACNIEIDRVNIKATTEEGLGFSGRGEGIASHAVCLLND